MNDGLAQKAWWNYLGEDLRELLYETEHLIQTVESWPAKFHDYSFVIFPAAKAYEGFLKKLFLDVGFITRDEYLSKRWRVGKALNPFLEKRLKIKEGVYDKLVTFCGGEELAAKLWQAWKLGRNTTFHWFPNEENALTFVQAKERFGMLIDAFDAAFRECKINKEE